jgi:hypothetical protein
MASIPLKWDTNLRANLVLWPKVVANIGALAQADGQPYVEEDLLKQFTSLAPAATKAPTDSRAVRNTFEALALAGLAYKDASGPPTFRLSDLGASVFTFLGVIGDKTFANGRNRRVLADAMIAGLSIVVEYRAIWMLFRKTNGLLSNEELNRAMGRIQYLEDIPLVADRVLEARQKKDPALIGSRFYKDDEFADESKRSDQRKAMNPQFLLAGAGRLLIAMEDDSEFRRLEDWAIPVIDRRLDDPSMLIHAGTDEETVRLVSEHACVAAKEWRTW